MAIFIMLFRKIAKNRWLVLSLLVGMILCIALSSSMPIYKNAILQRMLQKDLEQAYANTGTYPSALYATTTIEEESGPAHVEAVRRMDRYWSDGPIDDPELSTLQYVRERATAILKLTPADPTKVDPEPDRRVRLLMRTDILDHVQLVDGRFPSPEPVNGVYETLVIDRALVKLDMLLGQEFVVDDTDAYAPIRVVPVGVVKAKDPGELYWNRIPLGIYATSLILDERLFESELMDQTKARINAANWFAAFDFGKIEVRHSGVLTGYYEAMQKAYMGQFRYLSSIGLPAIDTLSGYEERESTLRSMLWTLNVPLYALIAFYLYMVSNLLIERQKPEIAVLRSRGASRLQIVLLYAAEGLLYVGIAFAVGPFVGMGITQALGSTSSFMSFVQRAPLDVRLDGEAFLYAGGAALAALILNLAPVFSAARVSIVNQKRMAARQKPRSFWHLFGLDFILLGISIYGLFTFRRRIDDLVSLGLGGRDMSVDPLLFAVPSLFILGFGLLALRLYPFLIRFLYWLGKSRWTPSLYSSMLLVGRRSTQYQGLMLFMILTVGTGIFNASAARTMNLNMEDQIWYGQGAELVVQERWPESGGAADAPVPGPPQPAVSGQGQITYREPPFERYRNLPGIQAAARVYQNENARVSLDEGNMAVKLVGIDTDDFGRVSRMKDGLLPHHFYDYLNLIAEHPYAALISESMAEQHQVKIGDSIQVSLASAESMAVTVYGIIDYFPAFMPNPSTAASSSEEEATHEVPSPMLVVAHLETVQAHLALEPYEVWLDVASSEDRQRVYDAFQENRFELTKISDTYELITESRNDPFRMAMNGVMSLGFIMSLAISFAGFLIYWLLSLQGRLLQFGVFRAMGISFAQLIGMLAMEQLLTSGAGIVVGFLAGGTASLVFVPMFQLSFDPGRIVPPFEVTIRAADTLQLLGLTLCMLLTALGILSWLLSRMKIAQAVKLGED